MSSSKKPQHKEDDGEYFDPNCIFPQNYARKTKSVTKTTNTSGKSSREGDRSSPNSNDDHSRSPPRSRNNHHNSSNSHNYHSHSDEDDYPHNKSNKSDKERTSDPRESSNSSKGDYSSSASTPSPKLSSSSSSLPPSAYSEAYYTTDYNNPYLPATYNIYVGGLSEEVDEGDLYNYYISCGPISLTRIFRNKETGEHMGYGFVHFTTPEGQTKALSKDFNKPLIKNCIGYTKIAVEKSTLFVGNLPQNLKEHEVQEVMKGLIGRFTQLVLKIFPPPSCSSRGFCFIKFDTHKEAEDARKILSKTPIMGKILSLGWADPLPASDADEEVMSKISTLFVNQIPIHVTEDQLHTLFQTYGELVKCRVVRNPQTQESRGFAFVEYKERGACLKAMNALSGYDLYGAKIDIVLARPQLEQQRNKSQGTVGPVRKTHTAAYEAPYSRGRGQGRDRGGYNGAGAYGYGGWYQPPPLPPPPYYGQPPPSYSYPYPYPPPPYYYPYYPPADYSQYWAAAYSNQPIADSNPTINPTNNPTNNTTNNTNNVAAITDGKDTPKSDANSITNNNNNSGGVFVEGSSETTDKPQQQVENMQTDSDSESLAISV